MSRHIMLFYFADIFVKISCSMVCMYHCTMGSHTIKGADSAIYYEDIAFVQYQAISGAISCTAIYRCCTGSSLLAGYVANLH